jgi:purine-binding chemotaxis protein CheW
MAHRRKKVEYKGDELQYVSFRLGKETYAVDVKQVREIGRVESITKVPRMPHYIEGVMNLRGQVTTVVDLRKLLGITDDIMETPRARIIVAEVNESQLGLIVDVVRDVIRVSPQSVSALPKSLPTRVDSHYLTGVCMMGEEFILLMDLALVLSPEQMDQALGLGARSGESETSIQERI